MKSRELDRFGKLLMAKVRDDIREDIEMTIDGRMKDRDSAEIRMLLAQHKDSLPVIQMLLAYAVDSTIQKMLYMFEEMPDSLHLTIGGEPESSVDLNSISDGLAGELYGEKGWIAKYSKYPQSLLGT
jgi:hypothetical protein